MGSSFNTSIVWFVALMFICILGNSAQGKKLCSDSKYLPELVYDVRMGWFPFGDAKIIDRGEIVDKDDGNLRLIEVLVNTPQLKDRELIFLHPESLMPVKVLRDVYFMGRKENIKEFYDQDKGEITIINGEKTTKLNTDVPVDNVFSFIVRLYVNKSALKEGTIINLPTGSFSLKLKGIGQVKTAVGKFDSIKVSTSPKRLEIWVSKRRSIPIRISGAVPLLPYKLVLKDVICKEVLDEDK